MQDVWYICCSWSVNVYNEINSIQVYKILFYFNQNIYFRSVKTSRQFVYFYIKFSRIHSLFPNIKFPIVYLFYIKMLLT